MVEQDPDEGFVLNAVKPEAGSPVFFFTPDEMRLLRTFLNNDGDTDGHAVDTLAQRLDKYLGDLNFE